MNRRIHRHWRSARRRFGLRAVGCCGALAVGAGIFLLHSGPQFTDEPLLPVQAAERTEPIEQTEPETVDLSGWKLADAGWNYLDADGNPVEGLYRIGSDFYYFANHLMVTGFYRTPDGLRFFYRSGRMAVGEFVYGGYTYLTDENGVLLTGWQQNAAGERRYCLSDGRVAVGETRIDGTLYCFSEDGELVTGWYREDGWFYRDAYGVLAEGLTEIDGVCYYFGADGMETGLVTDTDGTRYFNEKGEMVTGTVEVNGVSLRLNEEGLLVGVQLDVQPIYQNPALPNGCEITSMTELLQYLGFSVSHTEMAEYLSCAPLTYADEVCYAPDPEETFVGNPATASGWYCFEKPVIRAANQYLSEQDSDLRGVSVTGADEQQLFERLQAGEPVVVWATQQLADPAATSYHWTLPDGSSYSPLSGLHCVVLSGIDLEEGTCTVSDPIYGVRTYDLERFMEIFEQVGSRAIVVE